MEERNVEAVRRTWAAFDAGDADAFAAAVAPEWRELQGDGTAASLADALAAIARLGAAFGGVETTLDQVVAAGDLVAVRTTTRGVHRATGTPVVRYEIAIHRVEDGRVAETWSQGGSPSLDEQLPAG